MNKRPNPRLQKSFEFHLRPHGTRARYQQDCRCFLCRLACSQYAAALKAKRKAGEPPNGLVDATKSRKYLIELSESRVGMSVVEDVTGIRKSILSAIRSGKSKHVRAHKERLILGVTKEARLDGSFVPSAHAKRMVRRLRSEGFSQNEIARRSGVGRGVFKWRRFVFARTEMKIEKFYNLIMQEAA
jgi:hypothetical protein